MPTIVADEKLVSRCGLYCGACRAYLRGRCPGCAGNEKATWCKVRSCCAQHSYASCADCREYPDPVACKLHNNVISRLFGLIFGSDRRAGVLRVREVGRAQFAAEMAASGRQAIKRR